jgi:hypothetical protein
MIQRPEGVNLENGLSQRDWLRHVVREWSGTLSSSQFKVALMVFDRTIMWGKEEEAIRMAHFTGGVWNKSGACYHSGTGLTENTVRCAVKELEQMGLIIVTRMDCVTTYYKVNLSQIMPLPTPKRLQKLQNPEEKNTSKFEVETAKIEESTSIFGRPIRRSRKEVEKKMSSIESARRPTTLKEARDQGVRRKETRKDKHAEAMLIATLTKKGVTLFWREACLTWFPDSPALPLSVAQQSAMWSKQKQFNQSGHQGTFAGVVEWSCQNWVELIRGHFDWMKDAPMEPDAWFFIRQVGEFIKFYDKREGPWRDYMKGVRRLPSTQGDDETKQMREERAKLDLARKKLEVARSRCVRVSTTRKAISRKVVADEVELDDIEGTYE